MKRLIFLFISFFISLLSFAQQVDEQEDKWYELFFTEGLKSRLSGDFDRAANFYVNCLKINPRSASIAFELSRISNAKRDFEGANKFIDLALACDSFKNVHYLRYAVDLKLSLNKFLDSVSLYNRLIELEPNEYENYLNLAQIYSAAGSYSDALKVLDSLLQQNSDLEEYVIIEKSKIYLKQKKNKKAFSLIDNLNKENPNNSKFTSYYSSYYLAVGDTAKAIQYLIKSIQLPEGELFYFDLSDLYLSQNQIDNAYTYSNLGFATLSISSEVKYNTMIDYLQHDLFSCYVSDTLDFYESSLKTCILQYPENEAFYSLLAIYYTSISKDLQAIEVYEQINEIGGLSFDLWRDFLLLLASNDSDQKLLIYSKESVNQFPDEPFFLLFYGQSLQMNQSYAESLKPLLHAHSILKNETSSNLKSLKISVLNTLAGSYYYVDSISNAFSYFEEVLALDNYNLLALNNYSYYLSLLGQDLEKAERMSRQTIDLDPNNSTYLDTYAWVLYKLKRYNEALFIIERAVDNLPEDDSEVLDHYGDILFSSGDKDKALIMWRKAYELDSDNQKILDKIEANQ